MKLVNYTISLVFCVAIILLSFKSWGFGLPVPQITPLTTLAKGNAVAFEFPEKNDVLKEYLPKKGVITVIFDRPYKPLGSQEALLFQTQNTFVPILLNPYSGEDIALVVCTSENIANQRLKEMNYQWVKQFGPGKGIARLNS